MKAAYGAKCDGAVNITVFNHAGTFDVTKRMIGAGVVEGPVITFQRLDGTTYVAGFDLAEQCNPYGDGTITVTSWAQGKVSGSFDVQAQKTGSGQTRRFSGTFSFHH